MQTIRAVVSDLIGISGPSQIIGLELELSK